MNARGPDRQVTTKGTDVVRWGVGCALGVVALVGIATLVFLVSLVVQPPTWVQVVLGVILTVGAAIFTWLIVAAWQRTERSGESGSRERA